MHIGIIGKGMVGTAVFNAFSKIEKIVVDLNSENSIEDLIITQPNFVFVCLPSNINEETGKNDISLIDNMFSSINTTSIPGYFCNNTIFIIKSTIAPEDIEYLMNKYSKYKIIYNPEFLRDKHSTEDFISPKFVLLGGAIEDTKLVEDLYHYYSDCDIPKYFHTDAKSASFVKLIINAYLANKVTFFNFAKEYYTKTIGTNWNFIRNVILSDTRIGESHTFVPGHDGKYGFGGKCLPKDSKTLYNSSVQANVDATLLKAVLNLNDIYRGNENE